MSAMTAIIALGFLFAAGMAWKCFELIREASKSIPDDTGEYDPPIDYRKFKQ